MRIFALPQCGDCRWSCRRRAPVRDVYDAENSLWCNRGRPRWAVRQRRWFWRCGHRARWFAGREG